MILVLPSFVRCTLRYETVTVCEYNKIIQQRQMSGPVHSQDTYPHTEQEVWLSGSADTVSPCPSNDTGTVFCFPEIRVAEMRHTDSVTLSFDLETGVQCSTCRGVISCQFW